MPTFHMQLRDMREPRAQGLADDGVQAADAETKGFRHKAPTI